MKIVYLKNKEHLWGLLVSIIFLQSVFLYVIIYTKATEAIIIFFSSLLIFLLIIFFGRKYFFLKVEINNNEIIEKYKKKIKKIHKWEDIVDVLKSFHLRTRNLRFINKESKEILINVNNRKIRKIIGVCPREDLKEKMMKIKFVF